MQINSKTRNSNFTYKESQVCFVFQQTLQVQIHGADLHLPSASKYLCGLKFYKDN